MYAYGELVYKVTIDGEVKTWMVLDHALTDVFTRGWGKIWVLETAVE